MKCLTERIHHDGRIILPANRSASNLIQFSKEKRMDYPCLNCRGLAVVMTELCLAYGFAARSITCVQMERQFLDSHVATIAYSKYLSKWIYLDPSYNLIIKNENGQPLDIYQIRNYILEQKNIYPNKDANFRGESLDFNVFIEKFVKKLIRFYSPINLYPGYDNDAKMNEVELLPSLMYQGEKHTLSNPIIFWYS